jgi:hypothetical protein
LKTLPVPLKEDDEQSLMLVRRRIYSIEQIYNHYFTSARTSNNYLCMQKVLLAVRCYFRHIEHMKTFHGIKIADRHKRAAFTMFWIAQVHPIQIYQRAKITQQELIMNELLAVHAGIFHLNLPSGLTYSGGCLRNLVHTLLHRNASPEILASTMYLFECACLQKRP